MTPEQFVYWLQGFFELEEYGSSPERNNLTPMQIQMIKDHLKTVFDKKTPLYGENPYTTHPYPYTIPTFEPYKVTCTQTDVTGGVTGISAISNVC